MPAPRSPLEVRTTPEEAYYLPGQEVEIKISFTNVSSETIILTPFPLEIQVKPQVGDEILYQTPIASKRSQMLLPGHEAGLVFTWDQKDKEGNQIPPGWYRLVLKELTVTQETTTMRHHLDSYTVSRFLIQYPQGAMEKTIEPDQSQTVNGVTVTLERIELTAEGSTFQVFFIPPGYTPTPPLAPGVIPPPPGIIARAEYSVSGITWNAGLAGFGTRDDGMKLVWGGYPDENLKPVHGHADYLNPVPTDAKELTFTITRLGDWQDPWEFKVPLE